MRVAPPLVLLALALVGCGPPPGGDAGGPDDDGGTDAGALDDGGAPPDAGVDDDAGAPDDDAGIPDPPAPDPFLVPCAQLERFPRVLHSTTLPIDVHYQLRAHRDAAEEIVALLDAAWPAELAMGFRAPVPDDGACGDDARFDAFVWEGHEETYVDLIDYDADTNATYMVLDPWGPYGGELLHATVVHELNHALQATDDWYEPGPVYEASAQYIEHLLAPEAMTLAFVLSDFQLYPEWSLDHYDDYETWFMYGGALFLLYLDEEGFHSDGAFVGEMWARAAAPGVDWEDALDEMLAERAAPSSFFDEAVAFARWRAVTPPQRGWPAPYVTPDPALAAAMALGTVYLAVPDAAVSATVVVTGAPARVQAFDDDGVGAPPVDPGVVDVSAATLLAVTVLPPPGTEDAAARTDEVFDVAVTFAE